MPSSTLVACRASVMLGSLIALPAAALFWPSFPAAVDCVMASVGQPRSHAETSPYPLGRFDNQELSEAPRFESGKPQGPFAFAQATAAGSHARPLPSNAQPQLIPLALGPRGRLVAPAEVGPNVAASYVRSTPADAEPMHRLPGIVQSVEPARDQFTSAPAAQRAVPAGMQPTSMRGDPSIGQRNSPPNWNADTHSATIQELQKQLRRRGVTYSLLETLGTETIQYRFHCRVAVAGNARYTRQFEANNADPLAAMQLVLGQIESWQSGRRP